MNCNRFRLPFLLCATLGIAFAPGLLTAEDAGPLKSRLGGLPYKIAYETYVDGNWEIFVMNPDGSHPVNLTKTPKVNEHYPQISPDGTKLAYVGDVGEGRDAIRTLYVADIDGQNPRKIADHAREPFWSPDSKTICYLDQEFPKFQVIDYYTKGIEFYDLATGKVEIYRAQLEAIQRAQKYIYLENSYFGDDTILRELIRARRRGVDVRVIFPSENDYMIMQTRCQITANRMLEDGIRVYAYPGMSHVKAAIYDGWACVGSANFDKLSLRISQELDVGFSDPTAVAQLRHDLFEIDFQRSKELNGPVPLGWEDFFVKALADQL